MLQKQDKCVNGGDEMGNDVDLIKPGSGVTLFAINYMSNKVRHVRIQTGSRFPPPPPPPMKNHKNKGFLSNSGPDPLKNYEATESAFNVGPSSARKGNTIKMAFRLRADDGPLIVVFQET